MEKRNTKLAMMGVVTIMLSLLLINVGHLQGIVPDWAIRVIGIATMLCTVVSIVFTVRELANHSSENKGKSEQAKEKE